MAKGAPTSSKHARDAPLPDKTVAIAQDARVSDPSSKRQKTGPKKRETPLNPVSRYFADMGDTLVSEDEFVAWRGKPEEEKDNFLLKAGSEMLIHLMDREERRLEDAASRKKAEEDLGKLRKDFRSQSKELKQALDNLKNTQKSLTSEKARLHPLEKEIEKLKKANASLEAENAVLKEDQANGWSAEKEKIEATAFDEGIDSYIATFLAGAPCFNWVPQFGHGMAKYMEEFKGKHPDLIAHKLGVLKETLASEAAATQATNTEARPQDGEENHGATDL